MYETRADSAARLLNIAYGEENRLLTPPEKAARKIFRAATVKRPRTRYLFGFGARGLVAAHAMLPDRAFDRLMRRMFTSRLIPKP